MSCPWGCGEPEPARSAGRDVNQGSPCGSNFPQNKVQGHDLPSSSLNTTARTDPNGPFRGNGQQ